MRLWKALPFVCTILLVGVPVYCQQLKPVPAFRLLSSGYGAAAIGIGGAFVAVADDLSTIYWNPAGLAQLPRTQGYIDFRYTDDSDEDFAPEVQPNRFESAQRLSLSGQRPNTLSISQAFPGRKTTWVPAFSYQRLLIPPPERELKETAGVVEFLDTRPSNLTFFQSEGTFREEFKGAEEEFTFGLGILFSPKFKVGGTWSFLRGSPQVVLTGNFHDSFVQVPLPTLRTDYQLNENHQEDTKGNYFRLGFLYSPNSTLTFGGAVRLPYSRKSEITLARTGTVSQGGVSRSLQEGATAESELEIPAEWNAGVSLRPHAALRFAGSVTYADWADAQYVTTNSSDPNLIPETSIPYPTLRALAGEQRSLLQWRGGVEYIIGAPEKGIVLRSGIFWDGQPFGNQSADRVHFKGFTFGAGFVVRYFRFDAAFEREKGDIAFTPNSRGDSHLSSRRWVFSIGIGS